MIEYLNILFAEVYKILFLLIPVLTAVAIKAPIKPAELSPLVSTTTS